MLALAVPTDCFKSQNVFGFVHHNTSVFAPDVHHYLGISRVCLRTQALYHIAADLSLAASIFYSWVSSTFVVLLQTQYNNYLSAINVY